MTALLLSLLTIATAASLATGLGLLLGRAGTQWFGGRGVSNLLMDVRGALFPFLFVMLLLDTTSLTRWLAIALVVGVSQGVAVARWISRRSGEWAPALVGGIALGRSGAALLTRRAAARGAVTATLGATAVQVLSLEGLLHFIDPGPENLGSAIAGASGGGWSAIGLGVGALVLVSETLASRLLQKRTR